MNRSETRGGVSVYRGTLLSRPLGYPSTSVGKLLGKAGFTGIVLALRVGEGALDNQSLVLSFVLWFPLSLFLSVFPP